MYKVAGVALTCVLAVLGYGLSRLPVLDKTGPLACAILVSVGFRHVAGYPESLRPGIQFASKKLLRIAIVLYGLRLPMVVVLHQGLGLLVRDAGTIVFSMAAMAQISKWMKADASLSFLLGVGTGVCGAAAIAAVSPMVGAKEEDTAIGAGIIALTGTVFAVAYTMLRPVLLLSPFQYGIWSGVSLHEIAHVALAAAPAGQNALAVALLAKLGRVFLLLPLSVALMYRVRRHGQHGTADRTNIEFPWFMAGFIAMSLAGSGFFGTHASLSPAVLRDTENVSAFLLTMAMAGLGLNVSFRELRTRALRPLASVFIVSVLLSALTWGTLV